MLSRNITVRKSGDGATINLHINPGPIPLRVIEAELLGIVFRHNDGLDDAGNIVNNELVNKEPLLYNAPKGLGGMEVPNGKLNAVRTSLESLGYMFLESNRSPSNPDEMARADLQTADLTKILDGIPAVVYYDPQQGYSIIVDSVMTDYAWMEHLANRSLKSLKLETVSLTDDILIKYLPLIRSLTSLNVARNKSLTGEFLKALPDDYCLQLVSVENTAMGDAALKQIIRLQNITWLWAHNGQFSKSATGTIPAGRSLEIRYL